MKVGLFVGTHQKLISEGGIGRYMCSLDKYMTGAHGNGLTIKRLEAPESKYETPGMLWWSMLAHLDDYDIIHVLGPLPLFQLLFKSHKNTIITTAHDFMPTSLIAANIPSLTRRISSKFIADIRISLNSDYLIAISTQTKDEAVELGFDRKKIKVINYGIDEKFFVPVQKKKDKNTFVVGYVGTFPFRKNVKMAVEAVKKIDDKNIRFNIYGRKDMEYQSLLEQARGDKRISFHGPFEDEKIVSKFDSFDLSVFPSVHEGFGLPIIEAQSRGLPVVVYKHAHVPKEVRKMCFEAEDSDHMAQIIKQIKDNGFNEKRRKATIAYARGFTWQKNVRNTMDFYREVG